MSPLVVEPLPDVVLVDDGPVMVVAGEVGRGSGTVVVGVVTGRVGTVGVVTGRVGTVGVVTGRVGRVGVGTGRVGTGTETGSGGRQANPKVGWQGDGVEGGVVGTVLP